MGELPTAWAGSSSGRPFEFGVDSPPAPAAVFCGEGPHPPGTVGLGQRKVTALAERLRLTRRAK